MIEEGQTVQTHCIFCSDDGMNFHLGENFDFRDRHTIIL